MKNFRMVLTISLLAIGGFILANTVDVRRGNEIGEVNLGESTVNDGTIRSLTLNPILDHKLGEDVDLESIECSSPEESWTHENGSLTAIEVPMLDTHGKFDTSIRAKINVKLPKSEGSSKGSVPPPPGWTGTAIGHYNIKKCTNEFLCQFQPGVFTSPKPYECLNSSTGDSIIYPIAHCAVVSANTWLDLDRSIPYYGLFEPYPPKRLAAEVKDSCYICNICKSHNFFYHTYLIDLEIPNTKMTIYKWAEANTAGPATKKQWERVFEDTYKHEHAHRDQYKTIVLDSIKPVKIEIKICNNCDKDKYSNKDTVVSENISLAERLIDRTIYDILQKYIKAYKEFDKKNPGIKMDQNISVTQ